MQRATSELAWHSGLRLAAPARAHRAVIPAKGVRVSGVALQAIRQQAVLRRQLPVAPRHPEVHPPPVVRPPPAGDHPWPLGVRPCKPAVLLQRVVLHQRVALLQPAGDLRRRLPAARRRSQLAAPPPCQRVAQKPRPAAALQQCQRVVAPQRAATPRPAVAAPVRAAAPRLAEPTRAKAAAHKECKPC